MSAYRVEIGRRAARQLAALERRDQQRVRAAISLLADHPRPPRCTAVRGYPSTYRVRVGDHRVVYRVEDDRLIVLVLHVGHRRYVYRDL